ncbi:MAG: putative toxin-antitoxin system toxin component, PIN family [Verrucomicrobiae bacterium]|nr:putative toxin-antitoxin system toxin component, PIN family [Verrucomicrobiae bacterium]
MFGSSGPWRAIREALILRRIEWAISTEILLEYEEVAEREIGTAAAAQLLRFIELLEVTRGNIRRISPAFRFQLIPADPDDEKFADTAIAAEADYIITSDRHFSALESSGYRPRAISPESFVEWLGREKSG